MTVRKLISELKKMPQNLQVYYSHNDNSPWEQAGNTFSVNHCVKQELVEEYAKNISALSPLDRDNFERLAKQWVTING